MDLAALIISILALTAAIASLSVQITLAVLKYREKRDAQTDQTLFAPTSQELERLLNPTSEKDKEKMGEIFENPDLGKYSGIDEEFSI